MPMLMLALAAFVGTHFLMSHMLRAGMVRILGTKLFLLVYTVVSFATLYWVVRAFSAAPYGELAWEPGNAIWVIATALMWFGSVLLAGSLIGNPAAPDPTGKPMVARQPWGVFTITRHPMMWGIAIWAVIHVLVSPRPAILALSVGMIILALGGAWGQDVKKSRLIGTPWRTWMGRTSFIPFARGGGNPGPVALAGGTVLWLLATFLHPAFREPLAGIWRWVF